MGFNVLYVVEVIVSLGKILTRWIYISLTSIIVIVVSNGFHGMPITAP